MNEINMTQRQITIVEPDDSKIEFYEVLLRSNPSNKTMFGRIRAVFAPWITVAVPLHLKSEFPSGMTHMDGRPLWNYKLVDGVVYALHPQSAIYCS